MVSVLSDIIKFIKSEYKNLIVGSLYSLVIGISLLYLFILLLFYLTFGSDSLWFFGRIEGLIIGIGIVFSILSIILYSPLIFGYLSKLLKYKRTHIDLMEFNKDLFFNGLRYLAFTIFSFILAIILTVPSLYLVINYNSLSPISFTILYIISIPSIVFGTLLMYSFPQISLEYILKRKFNVIFDKDVYLRTLNSKYALISTIAYMFFAVTIIVIEILSYLLVKIGIHYGSLGISLGLLISIGTFGVLLFISSAISTLIYREVV